MQVLIVDSSPLIVQRLEEMLSEAAHIKAIYSSVFYEQAFRLFTENKPDLVLLGISLQTYQPIKLLQDIKNEFGNTPVIILSINTDEFIHEQCRMSGADYFLDKYKDFEKIPEIIGTIAGRNQRN